MKALIGDPRSGRTKNYYAEQYRRQGYDVSGNDGHIEISENWKGPVPDLYAVKNKSQIAMYERFIKPNPDEIDFEGLAKVMENPGVKVLLMAPCAGCQEVSRRVENGFGKKYPQRIYLPQLENLKRRKHNARPFLFMGLDGVRTAALVFALLMGMIALGTGFHHFSVNSIKASIREKILRRNTGFQAPRRGWFE